MLLLPRPVLPATVTLACAATVLAPLRADAAIEVAFSGDARLRYENDWDSQTATGSPREDRERGRVRLRVQGSLTLSEAWSFTARLRSGDPDSQQSSHLSFWSSDDMEGDVEGAFDRYYFQYRDGDVTAWFGRNSVPFWQQNEMVWDDDVTPTGAALIYRHQLPKATLTASGGAFALPDGAVELNGTLFGAQLMATIPLETSQLILAGSYYQLSGDEGAKHLRNRNGARDYRIGTLHAQWSTKLAGRMPIAVGLDLIENFASYRSADVAPFGPDAADETTGVVGSLVLGELRERGDWLAGYYYARIETFAVNASYAQDDWARFGSSTQSDLTDIQGHELRAAYAFSPRINVMVRAFFVEAITTVQDGSRLRIDLNWKF